MYKLEIKKVKGNSWKTDEVMTINNKLLNSSNKYRKSSK